MAIRFYCYSCGQQLEFPDGLAGQHTKCGGCGAGIRVPAVRSAPEAAPSRAALPMGIPVGFVGDKAGVARPTLVTPISEVAPLAEGLSAAASPAAGSGLEPEYQLVYDDEPRPPIKQPPAHAPAALSTAAPADDEASYELIYDEQPNRGLKPRPQPSVVPAPQSPPAGITIEPAGGQLADEGLALLPGALLRDLPRAKPVEPPAACTLAAQSPALTRPTKETSRLSAAETPAGKQPAARKTPACLLNDLPAPAAPLVTDATAALCSGCGAALRPDLEICVECGRDPRSDLGS